MYGKYNGSIPSGFHEWACSSILRGKEMAVRILRGEDGEQPTKPRSCLVSQVSVG